MRTKLLTTLKRLATELLAELEQTRQPSAYPVDIESHELMQQRKNLLEGIARGEMAIEQGRTVTHEQARKRMARWLK